jgi:hypothetical protein
MSPEERQVAGLAMTAEHSVLMIALGAVWSASLARTSLFLGVLSAAGLALGFASQAGVDRTDFIALTVVALLVVLFLGVATFVRLVQVQREAVVYIVARTGSGNSSSRARQPSGRTSSFPPTTTRRLSTAASAQA